MSDPRPGQRRWDHYVRDMLAACDKIVSYNNGLDQTAFVADVRTYDATLRNLEILGEAATHIPVDIRESSASIPWRALIGTRNQVIHGYLGIDDDIIWSIVRDDIPVLMPPLRALLEQAEGGSPAHCA